MVDTLSGSVSKGGTLPLLNINSRIPDELENVNRNNDNLRHKIRVAMPCEVVSFDAEKQTIVAQPLIREKMVNRLDGSVFWQQLPQLVDVPVQFPQAGNFLLTMPIKAGDEVIVLFQDMCFDAWHTSGGIQNWNDRRRHDLSDGIAIPGLNSLPNVIEDFATDATELRTRNGHVSVSVGQTGAGVDSLNLKSNGSTVEMKKKILVSDGVPANWDHTEITVDTAKITLGKTNVTVVIEGVPVQVPTDTIDLDAPRVRINGVGFP